MNKVFKVIWSEARNAYVVVSEMAKSHGTKSCSTKKLLAMLIATGVMTCASVAPVMAANLAPDDYQIEAGNGASASGQGSVAIGASSVADREAGVVGAFAPEGADSLTWRANGGAVSVGSATLTRQITNVAAGTADTDAVNVAQLQEATQNSAWHLSAEEDITGDINSRTKINHGDTVHFQGTDDNITISKEETEDATVMHVALSKNLVIDSVQAGDFFMNNEKGIGFGGEAYITQNGLNANDKVITNVAAGEADTDAVNVSQLNKVSVEAGKHSVVTKGANITVTP